MTNFDNDPQRIAAEAEALMALLDAELHADDPTHPDHVPMPSDEELLATAERAFDRASVIVEAETAATAGAADQVSDELIAEVLATWTAELGLVSSTSRAAAVGEGQLWKVRVIDSDLIATILGPDGDEPLYLTVSDVPAQDETAVTVTLSLPDDLAPGIALVAVIDYRNGVLARIPLHPSDTDSTELFGQTVVASATGAEHPLLTLDVLAKPR
ncbi:hypothetical protein [Rhodococcus sp. Q]|uniref:hypothetical protein n=1 Tax=Rhodococcus sp. Q TaxID=2502252 RepID=UPI0010F6AA85|nr:hypothetical protein [Rhodococcus sp. Q]